MDEMKELEFKKLINEIIFLKEDLKIKEEISTKIEKEFHHELNSLIDNDKDLKEQWETSLDNKLSKLGDKAGSKAEPKSHEKNDNIKKIYRDIVKMTHPDKNDDTDMHDTYKKATESYENNNLLDLIYYANKIGLEYNHNTLDVDKMKSNIESIKKMIVMYESSLPYKWYYGGKDEKMLKSYIAKQFLTNF